MRPDGPDMVADRIVALLRGSHSAHTPAGEERVAHQVTGAGRSLVSIHDAAPEEVPNVRRERVHLAPLSVDRQGKEFPVA